MSKDEPLPEGNPKSIADGIHEAEAGVSSGPRLLGAALRNDAEAGVSSGPRLLGAALRNDAEDDATGEHLRDDTPEEKGKPEAVNLERDEPITTAARRRDSF